MDHGVGVGEHANVDRERGGHVGRQGLEDELVQVLGEHRALLAGGRGLALEVQRHGCLTPLGARDGHEVDVQQQVADRVALDLADDDEVGVAVHLDGERRGEADLVEGADHGVRVGLERGGLHVAAVDVDGRGAGAAQRADLLAQRGAGLGFDDDLVQGMAPGARRRGGGLLARHDSRQAAGLHPLA